VIVENTEFEPETPGALIPAGTFGVPAPPAPTVIGKDVPPVNVNFVPPGKDVL
jgi:hypothetical protein